MGSKVLVRALLASTLLVMPISNLSFAKERTDKEESPKEFSQNVLQNFEIEMSDKGDGSFNYPFNYYEPRHIRTKNTVQQVGKEVSDEHVDKLLATTSASKNELSLAGESRNQASQNIKSLEFANPENFTHPDFVNAEQVFSNDGVLELTLNVQYGEHQFKTMQHGMEVTKSLRLRGYNGGLVGPTMVVKPGDTLKIRLNNLLPEEEHSAHCEDGQEDCNHHTIPHGFNNTNLHTHGLHVDPTGKSDNVFVKLEPGDSFDYEIHIPEDHVAGTFWYHAHVHGATTVQVASGVHGAIVIRGDYDNLPSIKKANERVMIMQTIAFDPNGEIEDNENFFVGKWHPLGWQSGWHYSINGQVMPRITMRPGSTELWRIVHAGVREYVNLHLVNACDANDNIPLIQLAADGIPFRKKRLADDGGAFLAPGYRSDVMVKAMKRGVYYLVDASIDGAADLPESYCDANRTGEQFILDEKAQNILARVEVKGLGMISPVPLNASLESLNRPAIIPDSELSEDIEYTVFNITPKPGVNPFDPIQFVGENFNFTINDEVYDPNRSRKLKLGTAQTWKLTSAFSYHPYHIHVNPFEVITRDESGAIIDRYWRDTVIVFPAEVGQDPSEAEVEIRTRYENFAGSFVMHCHILDHEDRGMMEKVEILP